MSSGSWPSPKKRKRLTQRQREDRIARYRDKATKRPRGYEFTATGLLKTW